MNEKIFVVAGTYDQYRQYARKKIEHHIEAGNTSITLSHFVYVSGPETFRGFSKVHGVFVGTFRDRPDIRDIAREIRLINGIHVSQQLIPGMFIGRGPVPNPTIVPT